MSYAEDLKDPRWQQKRLRVFEAAGFRCARCGSTVRTLHAHHKLYLKGHKPWEYEDGLLECLCELCHDAAHAEKEELEWIVAQQPTARLPMLTDAVAAALTNDQPDPALPPKARAVFRKLGAALSGGDPTALVDANNELQDLIDEYRDFRRGPGGGRSAA
jgi:hypothetical protein